jgi:hypothetical protein
MRSIRVSGLTALASAVAVALTAIPFSGFASGPVVEAPQTTSIVQASTATTTSAGTLVLSTTSAKGTVTYDGMTQEFSEANQCQIVQAPGAPELLLLEGIVGGAAGTAGFRNGDIGVYERDTEGDGSSNAAQCFRVDAGSFEGSETLGLTVGADAEDQFGRLLATSATVQVVAQSRSGKLSATLVDADGNAVEPAQTIMWRGRQSGSAITTPTFERPDSATSPFFSGIRLTAVDGAFSVRGATFELASQSDATFCADGTAGGTFTNAEGVKVIHLGNADGTACTAFGIRLGRAEDAQVWFTKPLDVDNEAQFIFEIPWDTVPLPDPIEPATLTLGSALPPAFIDFEVPGVTPILHEMPYCPDYLFNAAGELVGMPAVTSAEYEAAREDLDGRDMEPLQKDADNNEVLQTVGTQFACIGDRDAQVVKADGDGYDVLTTDLVYLIGDAKMVR